MKWSVYPAKAAPTKTILSLVFIFGFLVYVTIISGIFWAIFGLIVLFFTLQPYYFPTSYEVNEKELLIKKLFYIQRRKLSEFKKVYVGKNGVLLSPFRRKTFLNRFRGVFLFLPKENDEIVDFLKSVILEQQNVQKNSKNEVQSEKSS
jgi:hypothetical protein